MPEGSHQIAFQQIGLGAILKQYRLSVPPNQREYAWKETHVTKLLQDFTKAISEGDSEYFLGTVVTIPLSPDLLEVVDGQQRLATTAILLSEIRNYLKQIDEHLMVESITNGFLTDIDRAKRDRVTKMQLNVDDNEFFRALITNASPAPEPIKASHFLIQNAVRVAKTHIKDIVKGLDQKDHGDLLNRWIEFIEHRATVILLRVPSAVNAYKMFETLNDRGLRTSQADLIKNYVFGQAGARLAEAQQKWAFMRGSLESLDEEDITVAFLRHALMNIKGYVTVQEVYEYSTRSGERVSTLYHLAI